MTDSRKTAADLADKISETFSQRGQVYGPPEENFASIAAFWNAWLGARYRTFTLPTLDAFDVAHMSALIKKARLANSPGHQDSALDDATYTLLGAGLGMQVADKLEVQQEASALEKSLQEYHDIHTDRAARAMLVPSHPLYQGASHPMGPFAE